MKKTFYHLILLVIVQFAVIDQSFTQVPPPTLLSGEKWTQLFSAAQDYQSRGSIRYLVQDPSNPNKLCAILMAQEDSTVSTQYINKYIYYSYSTDFGLTWTKNVLSTSAISANPYIELNNGIPIIASSYYQGDDSIRVYKDVSFGGASFTKLGITPNRYQVGATIISAANGNIVLWSGFRPGFASQHTYFNGTNWAPLVTYDSVGGYSGFGTIDVAQNGEISMFAGNYFNGVQYGPNMWLRSTNNGVTFNYVTTNTIPRYIVEGSDTICSMGLHLGKQCLYINNTPGVVFALYSNQSSNINLYTNLYRKSRIYFWSQSAGLKIIADNSLIPGLTDTLAGTQVSPVCQPTLGKMQNGTLYCTFTAYLSGDRQSVLDGSQINCGEIFITYSVDNGNSWSTPQNLTNTPGIDEKHSSVVKSWSGNTTPLVFYVRDLKAGAWSIFPSWGKAPVYGIVKTIPATIGISQNQNVPGKFILEQNYPNPFNPYTVIKYNIVKKGHVKISVYDVIGNLVSILVDGNTGSGEHSVEFNGENLSSGIYFYKIEAEGFTDNKKMILLK